MFDVLHKGMSFNSDDRVGWKILKGLAGLRLESRSV